MHKDNPLRNRTRRWEREVRHDKRALEENSKMVTGFEFIESMEIFFYGSGGIERPHDEYIIYFTLKHPVLFNDFDKVIKEKLKGVIINE